MDPQLSRGPSSFDLEAAVAQSAKPRFRAAVVAGATLLLLSAVGITINSPKAGSHRGLTCGGRLDVASPAAGVGAEAVGEQRCREYRRVCFDQEHVISYDPAHSPANASAVPLPQLDISSIPYTWAGSDGRHGGAPLYFAPLAFRPAGTLEASTDLQLPWFDDCTVPVVAWAPWPHSQEAALTHLAARLWALQAAGAMSNASLLVVGTPPGERLLPALRYLLQPFTLHPIFTFAQLSAQTPRAFGQLGRCFQRAYLCAFEDPPAESASAYQAMQAVSAHYRAAAASPAVLANLLRFDKRAGVLKVLIEHRSGPAGNLLNWQELVEQCNRHAGWQLDPASRFERVQCRAATFSTEDPRLDLAAARSADVLVAVRGPACIQWLGMRDGSTLLELRPFESGPLAGRGLYANISQAIGGRLLWSALDVQDASLSQPSVWEQHARSRSGNGSSSDAARQFAADRHVTLPFAALAEMLQRIAAAAAVSAEKYQQQAAEGLHHVALLPGGKLQPVR
ncbi:hypothetical protein ABPG75_008294 [Micractinium tetrahymenae]